MSTLAKRIVPRLDIKGPNLVKGIQLEGLRVMGDPAEHARRYYEGGADELLYIDIVASLYERNNLTDVVQRTAAELFVPLTVGGGIRSLDDMQKLLRSGADKVAINTGAIRRPELLTEGAMRFGAQAIVLSIEAKRQPDGRWEAYTDNGRERTGIDAIEWAERAVELGAGEVLLTSVDCEGTKKGFDLELIRLVAARISVPLVVSGGAGSTQDIEKALAAGADAAALASVLHYGTHTVASIKSELAERGVEVRA